MLPDADAAADDRRAAAARRAAVHPAVAGAPWRLHPVPAGRPPAGAAHPRGGGGRGRGGLRAPAAPWPHRRRHLPAAAVHVVDRPDVQRAARCVVAATRSGRRLENHLFYFRNSRPRERSNVPNWP